MTTRLISRLRRGGIIDQRDKVILPHIRQISDRVK